MCSKYRSYYIYLKIKKMYESSLKFISLVTRYPKFYKEALLEGVRRREISSMSRLLAQVAKMSERIRPLKVKNSQFMSPSH